MSAGSAEPMRIVLYGDPASERRASMDRYASELSRALGAARPDATVVLRAAPDRRFGARAPFPVSKVANYYSRFVEYPRVAARDRADVFHVTDHAYAHLVSRLDPARSVVTCHDLMLLKLAAGQIPCGPRPRVATWMLRRSLRAMRCAARVIADSESTKRDVVALLGYPESRVVVVPLGVAERFRPVHDLTALAALRARYRVPADGLPVLHVGSAAPYKNVEGVLRALAYVRACAGSAYLLKVGRLTPAQWALARRLALEPAIHELGEVPEDDLPGIYALAHCLLFPSFAEGFGLPPLESMACGLPVVVSRASALAEVVAGAGLSVGADDPRGMAAAVLSLRDTTRAHALRERGRARARLFTWSETARRTAEVYEAVAARATGDEMRRDGASLRPGPDRPVPAPVAYARSAPVRVRTARGRPAVPLEWGRAALAGVPG